MSSTSSSSKASLTTAQARDDLVEQLKDAAKNVDARTFPSTEAYFISYD